MTLATPQESSASHETSDLQVARHWIDGEWVGSDVVSDSINPATGALLGHWADGDEAEARAAIVAARRAFDTSPWSRDRNLRNKALLEMADRFDAHADELGALVTKENGKRLPEGMFESTTAGATLRHNAGQALVSSPFSIFVKVVDGKVTYVQFLEDSYATAASFRKDGSWLVQTEPGTEPFDV